MRQRFEFLEDSRARIIFLWGVIGFILLSIIDLVKRRIVMLLYFVIIIILYLLLYKLSPKYYMLSIFLISIIEETIVYFIGGGLHGLAKSLIHDYIRSIPIFLIHAFLWLKYMNKYEYNEGEIFLLAGLHGFFWEIVVSGIIFNPVLLTLFGGTPFILYGLLVLIPERPKGKEKINWIKKMVLWLIYLPIEVTIGTIFVILFP